MKKAIVFLMVFIMAVASGCSMSNDDGYNDAIEEVIIDYGDAESFEAALNEGKNLENKVVRFVAGEFHPDSKLGYNVWAGEHLNFVSSRNPDIQEGDTVNVRTTTVENMMGSWVINYEKVDNAVVGEDTITYSNESSRLSETDVLGIRTANSAASDYCKAISSAIADLEEEDMSFEDGDITYEGSNISISGTSTAIVKSKVINYANYYVDLSNEDYFKVRVKGGVAIFGAAECDGYYGTSPKVDYGEIYENYDFSATLDSAFEDAKDKYEEKHGEGSADISS